MDILLIQPPVRDFYQTAIRTQPLGLAYLAAALRQDGHTSAILDCQVPGVKCTVPAPRAFGYMQQHYTAGDAVPFRLHTTYQHFCLPYTAIDACMTSQSPGSVGISCQFTPSVQEALTLAARVKALFPSVPVIAGGAHASALPREMLNSPHIDYVIIGEGEKTLPALMRCIAAGDVPWNLDGIGFKAGSELQINPRTACIEDLDALPFPDRDALTASFYTISERPYTMLLTSRGCPQSCSYCSVHTVMGKGLRVRSPENIIREIQLCRERYGISLFDIEDDNFTYDARRAKAVLSAVIDRFGENELQFFAMNGLSLISLTKSLLGTMKRAGFQRLDLAVGSSQAGASSRMDRPWNRKKADQAFSIAASLGLPATAYILFGLPGPSLREMMDSLVYAAQKAVLLGPSIFYPSPATKIYDQLYGSGKPHPREYALLRSTLFPVETENFCRLDLITLLRLARWINFIKRSLTKDGRTDISLAGITEQAQSVHLPCLISAEEAAPPEGAFRTVYPKPLTQQEKGDMLTALLLRRKRFYGIRRTDRKNKGLYTYDIFPYKTSSGVLELFFAGAAGLFIRAPAGLDPPEKSGAASAPPETALP